MQLTANLINYFTVHWVVFSKTIYWYERFKEIESLIFSIHYILKWHEKIVVVYVFAFIDEKLMFELRYIRFISYVLVLFLVNVFATDIAIFGQNRKSVCTTMYASINSGIFWFNRALLNSTHCDEKSFSCTQRKFVRKYKEIVTQCKKVIS